MVEAVMCMVLATEKELSDFSKSFIGPISLSVRKGSGHSSPQSFPYKRRVIKAGEFTDSERRRYH